MKYPVSVLLIFSFFVTLPMAPVSTFAQAKSGDSYALSAQEEARRSVELMGGADRVRAAAREATAEGGRENWAWALKLSDYLLLLDDQDQVAISIRESASRSLAGESSESSPTEHEQLAVAQSTGLPQSRDFLFPAADPWNFDKNYLSASVADADWTINEVFPGTKLILDGRYSFSREWAVPRELDCDCEPLPIPRRMVGTVNAHLQWGEGETSLEYGRLSVTGLGYLRRYDTVRGRFSPLRDSLRWGVLQAGKDDPLGIDDYYEFSLVGGGRTWQWQPSKSAFIFTVGVQGWVGYSWATSTNETYSDVSNPIIGSSFKGTISAPRWGQLFVEQRVVNGFTLSSPSAGGSVSREARFRAGYIKRLQSCLSLELYVEKRSFNFNDHRLDDLYTKSQRLGASLGCTF
jgi:hypothetical protein